MSSQPLAIEYHGKAQGTGHWRKGQELIDALAYVDPITDDVRAKVNKLIEEEMRRSTKKPVDYLKEMPPVPPARFEGHPMLKEEYERWVCSMCISVWASFGLHNVASLMPSTCPKSCISAYHAA